MVSNNSTSSANEPKQDNASSEPSEETKKWQRIAEKAREQARKYQRDALETSALRSDLGLLQKTVFDLAEVIKDDGDGDDIEKVINESVAIKKRTANLAGWQEKLSDLMFNKDAEWDSEELKEAREMWTSGDPAGAFAEAQRVLGNESSGDMEEIVAAKVASELAKVGITVDTGSTTTAPPGRVTRGDLQDLNASLGSGADKKGILTDMQSALDKFYTPR